MKSILMSELDKLVSNIERTFKNEKDKFTQCESNSFCLADTACDFEIFELLADFSQPFDVNWVAVEYLKQRGYKVYAGEKDSFGWLTGVIEPMGVTKELLGIPENKKYVIIYG